MSLKLALFAKREICYRFLFLCDFAKADLTPNLKHFFASFGNIQPLGIFSTVPDKQLSVWRNGLDGVEIDVEVNLTGNEILLAGVIAEVYVMHPVAATCVPYI